MPAMRAYLDYNATAPVRPEVIDAVAVALGRVGNPSSVHGGGRLARRAVDAAREAVATLAGAPADAVIFTSGGTEANDLALAGLAEAGLIRRIVTTTIEHDAVRRRARALPGVTVVEAPVGPDGVVDPQVIADLIGPDGAGVLVSVMAANNETGRDPALGRHSKRGQGARRPGP